MFEFAVVAGRSAVIRDGHVFDLATAAADDAFRDPMHAIAHFEEVTQIAVGAKEAIGDASHFRFELPVPRPRQVFAIGLNYQEHATESQMEAPPAPLIFTKYPSCLTGPFDDVVLSSDFVDWEGELVVVIGQQCANVSRNDAWSVVAGVSVGQDISDRVTQFTGTPPQFSMGKSYRTFGPIGPTIVPVNAIGNPDDLLLECFINGEKMQSARTSEMIFSVSEQIAYITSICDLYPGDLIFTGTPSGIGASRGRFLKAGDEIVTTIEHVGTIRNVVRGRE
jgi:2-keto-4-pentenoate hydratase/2-oxohepta-3-ene-1,7-dioic acid hydratase in catechol pathway